MQPERVERTGEERTGEEGKLWEGVEHVNTRE